MRGPVDPDHLPEGTQVDSWRVVRSLGGGAYGAVYLVEKDGELYALKLARFLGNSGDTRHTDERAQRELRCLLGLRHPHIAQVRNHGRWPHSKTGFFYVVMDYVEGCTLAEWVERTRATPHEVVVLFEKVLSAVAYVHAQGMLHRDLKPHNILVEERAGRPVVVDFGAAYFPAPAEPRLTNTRLPPGTPHYTSPEALHFEALHRYDKQAFYEYKVSDELYALGVTLFDLLTDPLPHSRPRSQLGHGLGTPRAREFNERVPLLLSEYTARLVDPGPALRPESVEVARRNLAEFLSIDAPEWTQRPLHPASTALSAPAPAEPVKSPPPEAPQPPAPAEAPGPPRRKRLRVAAVGALALGLLLSWGAALILSVRSSAREEAAHPSPEPPVASPASTPEKGTPVNTRPPSQPATPEVCAQQQPPPRDTPAWLQWCKCAAVAGTLVASQAGCLGAQVRQSLTEQCRPESVQSMELLGLEFDGSGDSALEVELDVKQPSNGEEACGSDASGEIPVACIAEGPLTSRVVRGYGKVMRGTLLSGYAWFLYPPTVSGKRPLYRWTEATLPDGSKHPVCLEELGKRDMCPNGAARDCAALQVRPMRRFEPLKINP